MMRSEKRLDWIDMMGAGILVVLVVMSAWGLYLAGEKAGAHDARTAVDPLPALLGGVLRQHGGTEILTPETLLWTDEAGATIRWAPLEDGSLQVWVVPASDTVADETREEPSAR